MRPDPPESLIFQSAKLGDIPFILTELGSARRSLEQIQSGAASPPGRIYGLSGGALTAAAFALALSEDGDRPAPPKENCQGFVTDLENFLRRTRPRHALNPDPRYGVFNLNLLRAWFARRMKAGPFRRIFA